MEVNETSPVPNGENACIKCSSPQYEEGYQAKLCRECRQELSRYPVKKSVVWAAIGVGILVIVSLYKFPSSFSAELSYERAVKLEKQHKYMSAEKELRKTLQLYPEYLAGSAHFMLAAFYNDRLLAADSALEHWAGVSSKDNEELISQVNDVLSARNYYFFEDSTFAVLYDSLGATPAAAKAALLEYTQAHPKDVLASFLLANAYYSEADYANTDKVCETLLKNAPDFHPVYSLLAASYREQKKYDEATGICNKLLRRNSESVAGNISLIKILLKQKQDQQALQRAQAIYALAPDDPQVLAALILVCHFNHRQKERDQLLATLKQSADTSGLAATLDIIQGKITYRD
ncbi:tetratricopeptide repeat protein [Chitinophaga japonensis]|uniref:Tetratricopeptide repeat protein n=1 Tax=Chitinophaga japonensis TaxID=104662 RepID=A0A562TDI9_CHIJA|nr:tetratricopeptide repeat protein [Chitinophaga japonensis]TWI91579.1 hypothetical protein LX66_0952 [Chitinophaga japonensis]